MIMMQVLNMQKGTSTILMNDSRWQSNSDGWVAAMNKSKQDKEHYQQYLEKTKAKEPLPYRDWLKKYKDPLTFQL